MQSSTQLVANPSPFGGYEPSPSDREMTFHDLLAVLARYRNLVLWTLLGTMVVAAIVYATVTRLYKATAEIQVQKEAADALSLDTMIGRTESAPDALESNITLQTEAELLKSEPLAVEVIKTLDLEKTEDFHPKFNPVDWLIGVLSPGPAFADPKNVPLEDAPGRRSHAVKVFEKHLSVKPVPDTHLITVSYYSSDPRTAAKVANLLVQDLVDYNFETRHVATKRATTWLNGQLADLRKQSESLQAQVVDLQRDSEVFTLGQTDMQGREQVYTPVLDRLQQSTAQLAEAQTSRIMKGALYQVAKDGDPELISGLAGGTLAGASPGISNAMTLLQGLRSQEAQEKSQLDQMSAKFGTAYPKLGELQASLASTRQSIHDEAARIAARAKNDYEMAQDVENKDRAEFEQAKTQAQALNSKAVEYELVRREADESRTLYENLLERLKEADLVAGLHSSNITPVGMAYVPSRPASPSPLIYLPGSIVCGLFLGICLASYRHATDYRIQDVAGITMLGIDAPIGLLPLHEFKKKGKKRLQEGKNPPALSLGFFSPEGSGDAYIKGEMVAIAEPRSPYTEALRALRTALMQNIDGTPQKVILVTSSAPGEGKSMLSLNLAIVHAQSGKKVLLVDGDLRTPVLHERFGLPNDKGLGDLLASADSEQRISSLRVSAESNISLDFLPAGSTRPDPAELLASDRMAELIQQWRKSYDYIFIDGPPLLPVTDSMILGRSADLTLVAARQNVTDRRSLERAWYMLRVQGVRKASIVLNGITANGAEQYPYYGYKPMDYYGSKLHA